MKCQDKEKDNLAVWQFWVVKGKESHTSHTDVRVLYGRVYTVLKSLPLRELLSLDSIYLRIMHQCNYLDVITLMQIRNM